MSSAIVIVSHNRLSMLRKCLAASLEQGADAIFVVDNASTDGSREFLEKTAREQSNLCVISRTSNCGSAVAFGIGMKAALNAGHEWLWLLDDDVEPLKDGLSTVLARAESIGPCCLVPAKLCADGRLFDYEYLISRRTLRRRRISRLGNLTEGRLVGANSGNFEGMLVHRDIISKIGLPERDFFICWDDAFFGMKAAMYFPNYYLNKVCLRKQFDKEKLRLGGKGFLSSSLWSRGHFLRNYRHVMAYLRNRGELSAGAYLLYGWECLKAAAITLLIEHDVKGLFILARAVAGGEKPGRMKRLAI